MRSEQQPPVSEVLNMLMRGATNEQIISELQTRGFSNQSISEAINQARTKASVEGTIPEENEENEQTRYQEEAPPPPPPSQMRASVMRGNSQTAMPSETMMRQPMSFEDNNTISESRGSQEQMEEIAESIIDEKWRKVWEDLGDMRVWKEKTRTELMSVKQEILRLEARFQSLQDAITGKVRDYDKGIQSVGVDIRALEKLLQKLIGPLSTNVSELRTLTDKLKK